MSSVSKSGKRVVLLVDDDKALLRMLTKLLVKNGFEVDTAETGKDAVEKIKQRFYDVALIDFMLPDENGTDILSQVNLSATVKIMLTGFPSIDSGLKALEQNADAYIVKPVQPDMLLSIIEDKLRR